MVMVSLGTRQVHDCVFHYTYSSKLTMMAENNQDVPHAFSEDFTHALGVLCVYIYIICYVTTYYSRGCAHSWRCGRLKFP